jgi:hypothetical protein
VAIDPAGAFEIARRSRGTPRIANRLLRRTRDFAEVQGDGRITSPLADHALNALDVDEAGLDDMDARILQALIEKFDGGPVGLSTLAVAVAEDTGTLEEVYEPYLIQEGFMARTPRGRIATPRASPRLVLEVVLNLAHFLLGIALDLIGLAFETLGIVVRGCAPRLLSFAFHLIFGAVKLLLFSTTHGVPP